MIDQEFEDDPQVEAAKFLLNPDEDRAVDPETQARLEQLLQAAGKTNLKFFITKIRKKTMLVIPIKHLLFPSKTTLYLF